MSKKKQRPQGQPEPSGATALTPPAVPLSEEPATVSQRTFRVVGADAPTEPVRPKELLRLMKAWRHGRATRTIWDALSDGYIAVFCVAVFGAMVVNLILHMNTNVARCTSDECVAGRTILPWVVAAALGSVALSLAYLFGPVLASAAEGFWLLDAPVGRRRVLGRRLVSALVLALLGGALVGALSALLTGAGVVEVLAWTLADAFATGGLIALAAAAQGMELTRPVRWLERLLAALAVVALLVVVAIAAGWMRPVGGEARTLLIPGVIGGVGLVAFVVGAVVAAGRLNQLKRARLVSGGALVSGMQGAMFGLDFGLMRDIVVERDMRDKGHVRSRPSHGTGLAALIWRDVLRLLRHPSPLLGLLVAAVMPYAMVALGMGILAPLVSGLALCVALVPTMGQLRVLTRTPGLARLLPFNMSQLKTAAIIVPGALALLWSIALVPAYLGVGTAMPHQSPVVAVELALITGLAGLNGAIRWTNARQINFETPMMATGAGAVPPSMIFNLIRGLDMVVLTTALVIFGVAPIWSLAVGVAALLFLRSGGFSRDELEAMQEQNRRDLAAQKADRQQQKIKVRR